MGVSDMAGKVNQERPRDRSSRIGWLMAVTTVICGCALLLAGTAWVVIFILHHLG